MGAAAIVLDNPVLMKHVRSRLRRSQATALRNAGVREEAVSALLGHAAMPMTRAAYARLSIQTLADEVNLVELIEALEEPVRTAVCTGSHPSGDGCILMAVCPVKGPIAAVHQRIFDVLRTVTLAELFGSAVPGPVPPVLIPSEVIAAACRPQGQ